MKRIIPAVLALILLAGCAHSDEHSGVGGISEDTSPESPAVTESVTAAPEVTQEPTSDVTEAETSEDTEVSSETEPTTSETTVITTAPTTVTTTEPTTVTTTAPTTVTTTEATTVTTVTTVTTTEAPATTEEPKKTEGDIMDSVEIMKTCPESASSRRAGVTYPTYTHKTYKSKTTGLERGVNILLPAGYDSSKKYPVLYMLHGIFCDEYTLPNDNTMSLAEISTNLAADGLAKEMIIVFPNIYATSDPNMQPSFGDITTIPPYDNFINDLVNDLMPFIEDNYSVLTGRDNTAIAGFSMGGREALYIGLQRPDLFAYCGAFSPAPGLTPGKDWAFDHPGQLSESELTFDGKDYSPKLLLICCGTRDGTVGSFPKSYHQIMERNKTKHIWYEVPDADHDGNAVKSGFNNFIRYIF